MHEDAFGTHRLHVTHLPLTCLVTTAQLAACAGLQARRYRSLVRAIGAVPVTQRYRDHGPRQAVDVEGAVAVVTEQRIDVVLRATTHLARVLHLRCILLLTLLARPFAVVFSLLSTLFAELRPTCLPCLPPWRYVRLGRIVAVGKSLAAGAAVKACRDRQDRRRRSWFRGFRVGRCLSEWRPPPLSPLRHWVALLLDVFLLVTLVLVILVPIRLAALDLSVRRGLLVVAVFSGALYVIVIFIHLVALVAVHLIAPHIGSGVIVFHYQRNRCTRFCHRICSSFCLNDAVYILHFYAGLNPQAFTGLRRSGRRCGRRSGRRSGCAGKRGRGAGGTPGLTARSQAIRWRSRSCGPLRHVEVHPHARTFRDGTTRAVGCPPRCQQYTYLSRAASGVIWALGPRSYICSL